MSKPAIPALLLIPDEEHDFAALYGIATAYAQSGELLNAHAAQTDQIAFLIPAMVCSSFAIELFLKFFITFNNAENLASPKGDRRGHDLQKLWERIKPEKQNLIVGMFRNPLHRPTEVGLELRRELFTSALAGIGSAPFVEWRYAHEINGPALMSQGSVAEVLDAFGHAAEHVMKEHRAAMAGSPANSASQGT